MHAPMAMAIGTKGSAVKPGEVESFSIERADNGFTARIRTKQKPLKKGEMRDYDAGSELEVYQTIDGLIERVRTAFADAKLEKKAA